MRNHRQKIQSCNNCGTIFFIKNTYGGNPDQFLPSVFESGSTMCPKCGGRVTWKTVGGPGDELGCVPMILFMIFLPIGLTLLLM